MRKRERPLKQPFDGSGDEQSRREFLDAVESITTDDIREHKGSEADSDPPPPKPRADGVEEKVDLHGLTVEQATSELALALKAHGRRGGQILIIVGKGHHSPDGIGILRNAIPEWLDGVGRKWVAQWQWAPRKDGGDGAIVARIKQSARKKNR